MSSVVVCVTHASGSGDTEQYAVAANSTMKNDALGEKHSQIVPAAAERVSKAVLDWCAWPMAWLRPAKVVTIATEPSGQGELWEQIGRDRETRKGGG